MGSLSRGTKADQFSYVPAGTVLPFAGDTAPAGWAICDGTAISRTDYPELYLAIGETWGNGDGSTTFNLPDLEGRFLRGADNSSGIDPDAGSRVPLGNGVAEGVGSLQDDAIRNITGQMSPVAHTKNVGMSASGALARASTDQGNALGTGSGNNVTFDASRVVPTASDNRPSNCSVNYIIKL